MKATQKSILITAFIIFSISLIYYFVISSKENTSQEISQPEKTEKPNDKYKQFVDSKFNLQFSYPSNWFGPEIYNYENGFRFEIGTDKVYPYGTGTEDRIYTLPNSYYITVQFDATPNSSPNSARISEISLMKNGEVKSDMRSETIKISNVKVGDFSGVEYISTLSETAQTEKVYMREVLLQSKNGDLVRVSGSANNVESPSTDWKSYYKKIDEQYAPIFKDVVNSIAQSAK